MDFIDVLVITLTFVYIVGVGSLYLLDKYDE